MNTLAENIRSRRIELGMSQEELAQEMGYTSRSTIAKIESGENDITQSKIEYFAKALKTTPAYLMGWIDNNGEIKKTSANAEGVVMPDWVLAYEGLTPEQQALVLERIRSFQALNGK